MRYTIGLDIGVASVGWAVINNDKSRIENLGVRLFKKAENPKTGESPNFNRRIARGTRRRIRRRAIRMQKIKQLFIKYNLISEKDLLNLYKIDERTIDVWELREIALDNKLDNKNWARVLTHIAKRRGYKSNRKVEEEDKEVGKLSKGTIENKKICEENSYRTIGEMFYKDKKFKNNKRNKNGEYTNTVLRSMLVDEVKILFEKQRKYGSEYASKEFEKEYLDEMCYQEKYLTPELLEKMLGKCTFEKSEVRAPKNSYTFERFMLLQKVNNLKIDLNGMAYLITDKQKKDIIQMAYNQAEIKYTQIRKKLDLPDMAKFTDLNYYISKKKSDNGENLTEIEHNKIVEDRKFVKLEGWHKIRLALRDIEKEEKFEILKSNTEIQNIIADALVRNKTDQDIDKYLSEKEVDKDFIEAAKKINFTKFGHLSYKAMNNILPGLEKGLTYDKACEEAGYNFKGNDGKPQHKLPPISKIDDYILNPVVLRAVTQTRKVINAIIDKYGSPIAINIETARELSKSFEERNQIKRKQDENNLKNEEIIKYIKETFNITAKPKDIVKVKLWREQQGRCAYSQKGIDANRLFEDNYVQIDHIIPFSRCFDDSYNNKVLVLTDENQNKKEKTPYEYFGNNENRWHAFEEFVNSTYKYNIRKKERLLVKNFSDDKSKDWISRNLNDTRYIARFMHNYIKNNLEFADSIIKNKVFTIKGGATAVLRRYWGLSKNRDESDKHHAQDAVIIACATPQNIKKVANYSRRKLLNVDEIVDKETGEIIDLTIKEPWPNFREEVKARLEDADNNDELYALKHGKFYNYDDIDVNSIKPIFVSRMPERKVTGAAHKDSMRSLKFEKDNFTVIKKPIISVSDSEIKTIVKDERCKKLYISDRVMYDYFYQKLVIEKQKAGIVFKDGYRKNSKNGEGPLVRSIKVPSLGISGVKLPNKSIADNDSMVRIDIFEKDSKYYMVPIYVADFVKKETPNKAVVAFKDESEWREMDESYKFIFSLYPNDLIKIKKKNEAEKFLYYNSANRRIGTITTLTPNEGTEIANIGIQNLEVFEKYNVDILGNITKINKEKREGVK